jgi:hypothetical protein
MPLSPTQAAVDGLDRLLFRQDEVITYRQARGYLTESAVRHRVRSGRWRAVHRNVYVTHRGPLSVDQRLWIAVLGCGPDSALAGMTAATRCGLTGFAGNGIHVIRPARLRTVTSPTGVVVHRSTSLGPQDVNWRGAPPYTTQARSLVDAAAWATSQDQARAVIAAGYQQRLVGGEEIHTVVHRLDVYYERWSVQVEIDGGQHLEIRAYWADMARQNDLWIAGDRLLRFPAWLIRDLPQRGNHPGTPRPDRRRLAPVNHPQDPRSWNHTVVITTIRFQDLGSCTYASSG